MSKVFVDRELLERAMYAKDRKELIAANRELRAILAQPAEAEGVVVAAKCVNRTGLRHNAMLSDYGLTLQHGEPLVRQSDHLATLSAMAAERDRLRKMIDTANSFQDALEAERDQLRAEVEALRGACESIVAYDSAGEATLLETMRSYRTAVNAARAALAAKEA